MAIVAWIAPAAAAYADSLKITTPVTASVGQPLTITVSGESDGTHRLYVYADESRAACAATPELEATRVPPAIPLAGLEGEAVPAGPFSKPFTYTPSTQLPVFCAYLAEVVGTEPDPVKEYLENHELAKPTSEGSETLPGAIEPTPYNAQTMQEYWERVEAEHRAEERRRWETEHPAAPSASHCHVPRLKGHTLSSVHRLLSHAHCKLGKIIRRRGGHGPPTVVAQAPHSGATLASGSRVAVTIARHH